MSYDLTYHLKKSYQKECFNCVNTYQREFDKLKYCDKFSCPINRFETAKNCTYFKNKND